VVLFAPMKTIARAEEMLMGEKNTFFELSSPSVFRRFKAKVLFASNRVLMMASLEEWI
jgi:hypothetical protein